MGCYTIECCVVVPCGEATVRGSFDLSSPPKLGLGGREKGRIAVREDVCVDLSGKIGLGLVIDWIESVVGKEIKERDVTKTNLKQNASKTIESSASLTEPGKKNDGVDGDNVGVADETRHQYTPDDRFDFRAFASAFLSRSEEVEEKKSDDVDDDNVGVANETLRQIVELCQAYILIDIYTAPADTGLAIHLKTVGFRDVTTGYDRESEAFEEERDGRLKAISGDCEFRYLVMISFGFQQGFHRGIQAGDGLFVNKCLASAKTVTSCMDVEPTSNGPVYSSSTVIDDQHTPTLYTRSMATLLGKDRRDGQGMTIGRLQTISPSNMDGGGGE
ncbi:hypothetical protein IW262DRAFT_1300668 [Armillaria fumosa]|nr:hypothetical protein IW262DRAFT_1300668 [Armillaria fumosa]